MLHKTVFEQAKKTYWQVWQRRSPLLRLSLVWIVLAVIGLHLSGKADAMFGLQANSPQQSAGLILHLFAALAGWYCAHRYLLHPQERVDYLPSRRQARFIATQLLLLLALAVIIALLLAPIMLAYMPAFDAQITDDERTRLAMQATYKMRPFVYLLLILFFSRLILAAPFMVRDRPGALRRSWRATKGHWLRLTALQIIVLLPAVAGLALAYVLKPVMQPAALLASTVGLFASLLLYTQLAENEYAALIKES